MRGQYEIFDQDRPKMRFVVELGYPLGQREQQERERDVLAKVQQALSGYVDVKVERRY